MQQAVLPCSELVSNISFAAYLTFTQQIDTLGCIVRIEAMEKCIWWNEERAALVFSGPPQRVFRADSRTPQREVHLYKALSSLSCGRGVPVRTPVHNGPVAASVEDAAEDAGYHVR